MYLQIVILIVCAVGSALIARSKGRTPIGWFFIGFFLGLIGLIIALCMSNLKEEKAKHEHLMNEQRRLREQLRQERMRNQTFQEYTNNRLDAHDDSLQIDTKANDAKWARPSLTNSQAADLELDEDRERDAGR